MNTNVPFFLTQIPQEETKESTSEVGFNVIIKEANADLAEIIEMVSGFRFSFKKEKKNCFSPSTQRF